MFNTTIPTVYVSSTNTHRWTELLEVLHETNVSTLSSSPLAEEYSPFTDDCGTRLIFMFVTVLFCFGIVSNLITVLLIVVMKRLHSPTYVTIACLAISDCMASSTRYSRMILPYMVKFYFQVYLRVHVLEVFTFFFLHSANFHIVLLSYIRYVFIVKPLRSLEITCAKVFELSAIIWMFSIVISGVYGVRQALFLSDMISFDLANKTEIGFVLYIVGVPFVLVSCFHLAKICHLRNKPEQMEEGRVEVTHSMSIMFSIIIMVYLITTVYPMLSIILSFKFKYRNDLFHFFLLINNCINPFIYFAFSPPVVKVLSRLRNYMN